MLVKSEGWRALWVEAAGLKSSPGGEGTWQGEVAATGGCPNQRSIGPLPRVLCKSLYRQPEVSGPTSLILSKIAVWIQVQPRHRHLLFDQSYYSMPTLIGVGD